MVQIIYIQFKFEPAYLNAWGAKDWEAIGFRENPSSSVYIYCTRSVLKFFFHYYNTHVKQYAGTLFDCITGVVRIQMAPNNKI